MLPVFLFSHIKFIGASQGTDERPSLLKLVQLPSPEGSPSAQLKFLASVSPFHENPPLFPNGCKAVSIGVNPIAIRTTSNK